MMVMLLIMMMVMLIMMLVDAIHGVGMHAWMGVVFHIYMHLHTSMHMLA
jgi:hypothetical protein